MFVQFAYTGTRVRRERKRKEIEPKTIYLATEELVFFPFLEGFIKMCECPFFPGVFKCQMPVGLREIHSCQECF